ncbi:MAG: hypothetical protein RID09_11145 [Coleofasciculus sp. G1-WW12-02]|uniref:hypothetical protein n=1 Tax=Coleofasciculus sp. G1-WW12-02 TaxID=3068483 RepID=UPI0032F6569E
MPNIRSILRSRDDAPQYTVGNIIVLGHPHSKHLDQLPTLPIKISDGIIDPENPD